MSIENHSNHHDHITDTGYRRRDNECPGSQPNIRDRFRRAIRDSRCFISNRRQLRSMLGTPF
jgi:hypothetical protein